MRCCPCLIGAVAEYLFQWEPLVLCLLTVWILVCGKELQRWALPFFHGLLVGKTILQGYWNHICSFLWLDLKHWSIAALTYFIWRFSRVCCGKAYDKWYGFEVLVVRTGSRIYNSWLSVKDSKIGSVQYRAIYSQVYTRFAHGTDWQEMAKREIEIRVSSAISLAVGDTLVRAFGVLVLFCIADLWISDFSLCSFIFCKNVTCVRHFFATEIL